MNLCTRAFALTLSLSAALSLAQPCSIPHAFHHENILGTSLDLKLITASDAAASRAEKAALSEIDRENNILSAWIPDSEFSRWQRTHGTPQRVSPELFEVLALFDHWRDLTGGALDASAETAVRAWKTAAAENREPTSAELAEAVALMQRPHWRLDPQHHTATHLDDAPIALNSFAKSYIAGHAADAALGAGATGVLLNIGGDIVLRGAFTEKIAIANPRADAENDPPIDLIRLNHRTIATSGSYRRGVDIAGSHFSHIIDPRTAQPVDSVLSSSVVAPDPSEAGALATAFSVMTPAQSHRLASALPGVDYLLLLRDGQVISSPGWSRLELPRLQTASFSPSPSSQLRAPVAKSGPLDLLITLELARVDDFRYRRPYVAVWIEDSNRAAVRTLALWYGKRRYLNELQRWNRIGQTRYEADGTDLSVTISSATRPPGKYTLRWDGKDDAAKPVKPGKYTVYIEVVREHGTYQLLHQEINFDGKSPAQFSLPGDTEVAGVQLDYGEHSQ